MLFRSSSQTADDLERLAHLYQAVNIKLDKCGGLTDGLRLAKRASALGRDVMVGNMLGSSLAMAPAFLLGQYCSIVDLDGPIFLKDDCTPGATYRSGHIDCAPHPWGDGRRSEEHTSELQSLMRISYAVFGLKKKK